MHAEATSSTGAHFCKKNVGTYPPVELGVFEILLIRIEQNLVEVSTSTVEVTVTSTLAVS